MRSARIRTAWKKRARAVTADEHAAAVAAAAWRVALNAAKNLHRQKFVLQTDAQRMAVMREYLYFFIHISDRCLAAELDDDRRARLITNLAGACNRHHLENARDLQVVGPGDAAGEQSRAAFVAELNQRMRAYSGMRFVDDSPGFEALRALGLHVQECLLDGDTDADKWTNNWVQDQVLNIDGPEAVQVFRRALGAVNRSAFLTPP